MNVLYTYYPLIYRVSIVNFINCLFIYLLFRNKYTF